MTVIADSSTVWSDPITLTTNEVWQCRKGSSVFITSSSNPTDEDGIELNEMHALHLSQGLTVRHRRSGYAPAVIVRESV